MKKALIIGISDYTNLQQLDPQSVTCGIGETFSQTDQRCEISGTGLLNACLDHIGICSDMNNRLVMLGGLIPLLILLVVPHVNAESDSKRASDGFNDGSNAARRDTSFNPACDPQGLHTSDGQHTSTYCNAWTSGYTSTWNSQYTTTPTDTFNQR